VRIVGGVRGPRAVVAVEGVCRAMRKGRGRRGWVTEWRQIGLTERMVGVEYGMDFSVCLSVRGAS
jgi:hypothetical protein